MTQLSNETPTHQLPYPIGPIEYERNLQSVKAKTNFETVATTQDKKEAMHFRAIAASQGNLEAQKGVVSFLEQLLLLPGNARRRGNAVALRVSTHSDDVTLQESIAFWKKQVTLQEKERTYVGDFKQEENELSDRLNNTQRDVSFRNWRRDFTEKTRNPSLLFELRMPDFEYLNTAVKEGKTNPNRPEIKAQVRMLLEEIQESAARGYAPAQYYLSSLYSGGNTFVSQDEQTAALYALQAAHQNHPIAQLVLANFAYYGIGILQRMPTYNYWLKKLADTNGIDAMSDPFILNSAARHLAHHKCILNKNSHQDLQSQKYREQQSSSFSATFPAAPGRDLTPAFQLPERAQIFNPGALALQPQQAPGQSMQQAFRISIIMQLDHIARQQQALEMQRALLLQHLSLLAPNAAYHRGHPLLLSPANAYGEQEEPTRREQQLGQPQPWPSPYSGSRVLTQTEQPQQISHSPHRGAQELKGQASSSTSRILTQVSSLSTVTRAEIDREYSYHHGSSQPPDTEAQELGQASSSTSRTLTQVPSPSTVTRAEKDKEDSYRHGSSQQKRRKDDDEDENTHPGSHQKAYRSKDSNSDERDKRGRDHVRKKHEYRHKPHRDGRRPGYR